MNTLPNIRSMIVVGIELEEEQMTSRLLAALHPYLDYPEVQKEYRTLHFMALTFRENRSGNGRQNCA